MIISFINLNFFYLFIEYFIGIIIIYMFIVFILLINNITNIILQRTICECLSLLFILILYLILNDEIYFFIGLNNFVGFNKYIIFDYLSTISKIIIIFFSFIFFLIISDFLKNYKLTSFEFLILFLFSIFGLIFLCSSNDLILVFLSIELISLPSYLLASFKKTSSYSVESGIKYLIIGAISSSFFLLGTSFFYYYTASLLLSDFKILFSNLSYLFFVKNNDIFFNFFIVNNTGIFFNFSDYILEFLIINNQNSSNYQSFIEVGLLLITLSIFIKLSVAPFHLWSLDVYEGSPTVSTFFFTLITKLSFFVFLFRLYYSLFSEYDIFSFYCMVVGFLSIFVGSFGNLRQKKIKTLIAYSSVSHLGFVLLAFSSSSLLGFEMFFLYLFVYMLSNIIIWYPILIFKNEVLNYKNKLSKNISDFVLLSKSNQILAIGLAIVFFSLAGIPPLIGFFTKFNVFFSLLVVKHYFISVFSILFTVISSFYYLRLIKILFFENVIVGKLFYPVISNNMFIYCWSVFILIFLFFNPTLLYLIIHKSFLIDTSDFNFYTSFNKMLINQDNKMINFFYNFIL
jgi:NADH-quinone oxidoreductase subunit N